MAATRKHPHDTAQSPQDAALAEVASTRDALRRTRRAQAPLADIRAAFCEAADALDTALVQATASGGRPLVRQLRMARDSSSWSVETPTEWTFRTARRRLRSTPTGHTPSDRSSSVSTRTVRRLRTCMALTSLRPWTRATRADAGHRGPHANHRRQPAARWVEPAAKVKPSVISAGATASTGQA